MTTVKQLADWIVANKKGKAFDYDYDRIINLLLVCLENKTIFCVTNSKMQTVGVACWVTDPVAKKVHVYDALTTQKGALKRMFKYFKDNYLGFTLEAKRKNGMVIAYKNVDRLYKLLK